MRIKGAGVAAVAALLIAGCTASPTPPTPSGEDGEITGTVSLWYLEDPDTAFMAAIKQGFEAKYPGTTVELTELPEDGFVTKIDTALLAQQPPDVAFIYEARWMKAGQVMPLTDTIARYGIDTSTMNQVALSECDLEGQLYCLGSLAGSVTLVYNKDEFDKAEVDYPSADTPWTIDEYAAAARQLAAKRGGWGATAQAPFTWADRRTHFSDDGLKIQGYLDDEPTIHMYDTLTGLVRDGAAPPPATTDLATGADLLADGQVAMAITDTEYAAAALAQAGNRWGVAPPPVEKAGDAPFVFVGTDKYGAFSDAANPEAAKALVAFIATEGNRLRGDVSDKPPLDSRLHAAWARDDEGRQETVKVMGLRNEPGLFVPGFWEVTAGLWDGFALMQNGEANPRDAIPTEATAAQESLDREWQTWEEIQ